MLVEEDSEGVKSGLVKVAHLRQQGDGIVEQKVLLHNVPNLVAAARKTSRGRARREELSDFTVGGFIQVARVANPGRHHNLLRTWTGPWRAVKDHRTHV